MRVIENSDGSAVCDNEGTFVANVVGCLAIGVFYGLFDRGQLMNT